MEKIKNEAKRQVIGKYTIEGILGKGGMGTVYLVTDGNLHMTRAMKELYCHDENGAEWKKRSLEAEVSVLKQTDHPMLPKVIDLFHQGDAAYLVMEYLEGMTLEQYLKENQKASEKDTVKWGIQLAEALAYLHSRKPPILYLDMKPANVILRKDGVLKLTDFGAALTDWRGMESGQYLGTPGYAPQEQMQGGSVSKESDVYALGATLYHLITGVSPALLRGASGRRPVREWDITISVGLARVIERAMAQKPQDRYCDMDSMRQELAHAWAASGRRRRSFILEHRKNLLYTQKESAGLYPYVN